jgi:hypothetical protein
MDTIRQCKKCLYWIAPILPQGVPGTGGEFTYSFNNPDITIDIAINGGCRFNPVVVPKRGSSWCGHFKPGDGEFISEVISTDAV